MRFQIRVGNYGSGAARSPYQPMRIQITAGNYGSGVGGRTLNCGCFWCLAPQTERAGASVVLCGVGGGHELGAAGPWLAPQPGVYAGLVRQLGTQKAA